MKRLRRWIVVFSTAVLLAPSAAIFARSQDAASLPPPPPDSPARAKYSHANDFLIRGTVFNNKALSFPGVELKIRRVGEKKVRWESYTNSRGEFALRVPQGSEYEMVLHVKGFADQTRTIDANNGGNEQSMVFRMEPSERKKK
jgi:hypothetical protein